MSKKLIYCLCLVIGATAGSAYADVLYCQSKLATGFFKKDGEWRRGGFKEDRFTIKFNEDLTSMKISGDKRPYSCEVGYGGELEEYRHILVCVSGYRSGETMQFNTKTLRFLRTSTAITSWVTNEGDTSSIQIGTCDKF